MTHHEGDVPFDERAEEFAAVEAAVEHPGAFAAGRLVDGEDVLEELRVLAGGAARVGLQRLDFQGEMLPPAHADGGLEEAVAGGGPAVGVRAVMDAAQAFEVLGVVFGQVGGVGDDEGVVGDEGGGASQEFGGERRGVPVFAGEVPAEAFLGGVEGFGAVAGGAGDGSEVDVPGDDESRDHLVKEALPSRVGERTGKVVGEGVELVSDRCGERWACHGTRLLPWLQHQQKEAFPFF